MALKFHAGMFVWLLLLAGCGPSVTVVEPPTSITRPTPTFDMGRFAAVRTINDFPGGMSGFTTTLNDILIVSDQLCFLVAREVLPVPPAEDNVRLLLNNEPAPLLQAELEEDEDFAEYCFEGFYTQDTYTIDVEVDEVNGRAVYGWRATIAFPQTMPFASFPGRAVGLTRRGDDLLLTGQQLCLELPERVLLLEGSRPPVQVSMNSAAVQIREAPLEDNEWQFCVDAPQRGGTYQMDVRLDTPGDMMELYRWEFIVDGS